MRSEALLEETARGLGRRPKELPAQWLYDERGSQLYERVTRLPDYYLPSREEEILRARSAEIAERTQARTLVELGSGAARNTRALLHALTARGTLERFVPLDVSAHALQAAADGVRTAYPGVSVEPLVGDFERDLSTLPAGGPTLVAFLGSTIGNLHPERRRRFLSSVRGVLAPPDVFLVGLDLIKDSSRLDAAYTDPGGVTEAFVRNALTAVNRELGASFHQARFAYEPRWDAEEEWMDIGLRALEAHVVAFSALELEVAFAPGELLRVEISAKFRRDRIEQEAGQAGLRVEEWWTDGMSDFALALMA
jgi:L-histidine Nalpha-methyltransferase